MSSNQNAELHRKIEVIFKQWNEYVCRIRYVVVSDVQHT